jgi:hypothetical protein
VKGVYFAGVASGASGAPLRLAITTPSSIGFGPGCSAISVAALAHHGDARTAAGVAANEAIIVARPPFANSSVNDERVVGFGCTMRTLSRHRAVRTQLISCR